MATVTHFFGQPTYDWRNALDNALSNGNLSPVGAAPRTILNLTSGTTVLTITGTGLVASNSGTLSAGTITGFTLKVGGVTILTENGFGSPVGFADFNTLMLAYNGGTQQDRDDAWDLTFGKEGLTVNGSNADFEQMRGSDFNDTFFTNGGDDFVLGGAGIDTINGGSGYNLFGFHGLASLGGSVTIRMNASGVAGGGTVTGTIDAGTVNTTFNNMERAIGTENADIFEAVVGFEPTFDNNFDWIGGGGNDTFRNLGATRILVNYDAEKFEHEPEQNVWGDDPGELGVAINLTATSKIVNLGAGNITITTGKARDTFGNTDTLIGIDRFRLTDAKDFFFGNDAGIRVQAGGGDDTLNGGAGRDNFEGDEGNDIINAGDGDDYVEGGLGNDTINAGGGTFDFIRGGAGTDTVNGDIGFDSYDFERSDAPGTALTFTLNNSAPGGGTVTGTLEGNATNTTFIGIERIGGTDANDTFIANVGFVATEDSDRGFGDVRGEAGIMHAVGGDGADVFTDNSGLVGGAFMVHYDVEKFHHDNFDGYWGDNPGELGVIVNLSTASVTANVGNGAEVVAAGRARDTFGQLDVLTNIKAFSLTDANDYVQAGAAGIYVRGGDGNDSLNGGNGGDEFNGDDGNDTLNGGAGVDQLYGQDGNDTMNGGTGNDRMNGDNGEDIMFGGGGADQISGGSENDTLNGDAGNDRLNGDDGDDILNGGGNNDELSGGQGNDTLNGGAESDRMFGDEGNDLLNGGTGADEMYGWMGDDTYTVDNIGDRIFEDNGTGTDTVNTGVTYSMAQAGEIEFLNLTGTAAISGFGSNSDNTINGNNVVNTLAGGAGNDTLVGKGGLDVLYGGSGADNFRYNATADKGDTVMDFNSADDTFQFLRSAFGNLALGGIAANQWQSGTSDVALSTTVRFFFEEDTGLLRYDSNGSLAGGTHIIATLQPGATMDIGDILMV